MRRSTCGPPMQRHKRRIPMVIQRTIQMPNPMLPQVLFTDRVESPIGTMFVTHDPEGRVRALDFAEFADFEARMRRLLRLHYGEEGVDFVVVSGKAPATIRQALAGYFAGDLT